MDPWNKEMIFLSWSTIPSEISFIFFHFSLSFSLLLSLSLFTLSLSLSLSARQVARGAVGQSPPQKKKNAGQKKETEREEKSKRT